MSRQTLSLLAFLALLAGAMAANAKDVPPSDSKGPSDSAIGQPARSPTPSSPSKDPYKPGAKVVNSKNHTIGETFFVNGTANMTRGPKQKPVVSDPIVADEASTRPMPTKSTAAPAVASPVIVTSPMPPTVPPPPPPPPRFINNVTQFYNTTILFNGNDFDARWSALNASGNLRPNPKLSNAYRNYTNLKLKFPFLFYGVEHDTVIITTEGFIHIDLGTFKWFSATSYVSPLMGNFDTGIYPDSTVSYLDDGVSLTVVWDNVALREREKFGKFSFAAVLRRNGTVEFLYKNIPYPLSGVTLSTNSKFKLGLSDGYVDTGLASNGSMSEYNRVSFYESHVTNGTSIVLTPLPTCLQFDYCTSCLSHDLPLKCHWCDATLSCSSGNDRNQNDWKSGGCSHQNFTIEWQCDSPKIVKLIEPIHRPQVESHTTLVVVLMILSLLVCAVSFFVYAYRNPHTYSGQLLIKYRPTQWLRRRGEARYTAATIRM